MRFWRLSAAIHANRIDGGYGLNHPGRWNSLGRRVTYGATVPSLSVLEKLVHLGRPRRLPDDLVMVELEAPDEGGTRLLELDALPAGWHRDEEKTRAIGDAWHDGRTELLLLVPSVILPLTGVADRNVVVNHEHAAAASMRIVRSLPFRLDVRLGP
jgi:RES domain-containing protein